MSTQVAVDTCPSYGGAGGGPLGRACGAWDVEDWGCPRCKGTGLMALDSPHVSSGPGVVKGVTVTPVVTKRALDK
jgi:hypothetical protein